MCTQDETGHTVPCALAISRLDQMQAAVAAKINPLINTLKTSRCPVCCEEITTPDGEQGLTAVTVALADHEHNVCAVAHPAEWAFFHRLMSRIPLSGDA